MFKSQKRSLFIPLAALAVLLVSALAYLPKITQLGFYRDDWYLLYGGNVFGVQRFYDIFASDRPFRGFLMSTAFSLFGNHILYYNLADFILRAAGSLGVLWMFRIVWPKQKTAAVLSALLFAVYPGFTNQTNALDFQAHLLSMTAMIFSICLSLRALTAQKTLQKILLVLASAALALLCMFGMEYYIGMEGLRLFLIWYLSEPKGWKNTGRRALKVLANWWPYVVSTAIFLGWRMFFFQNERYSTDIGGMFGNYLSNPLLQLTHNFSDLLQGLFNVSFLAWGVPFYKLATTARLRDWTYAFAFGLAAAAVVLGFWLLTRREADAAEEESTSPNWARDAVIIGALSVLAALFPIVFGERSADLPSRFTLPCSIGGVWMVIGLLYWATNRSVWRVAAASLLMLFSVMTQYANAVNFAEDWETAQQVWWQLAWRAPQLAPGTVLTAQIGGLEIAEDYVLWGPANLIYYPQPPQGALPISAEVLTKNTQQLILVGLGTERELRSFSLEKDFGKTLVLSKPSENSCLHVIDGAQPELSSGADERVARVAPYSQISQILPEAPAQVPPQDIFGAEPEHGFCYYYQKAALARQQGDWEAAAALGDEVREQWLSSDDWVEWMPFVQAYGYLGDFARVDELAPLLQDNRFVEQEACQAFSQPVAPQYAEGRQYLIDTFCE